MNVCILNSKWQGGGAEAISRSLYEGLQRYEDCNMFFVAGSGPLEMKNVIFPEVRARNISDLKLKLKMIFRKNIFLKIHKGELVHEGYATRWLIKFIKENQIDILHINNLHGSFLGIRDISVLAKYCKIVWTLHDMWAMTGHCVYVFECDKWIQGDCSFCPRPNLICPVKGKITGISLINKKKYFTKVGITFVAISEWMQQNFYRSILNGEKSCLIRNGIDTNVFIERNRELVRESYGIGANEFVVLFVSNGVESPFKGMDVLLKALNQLGDDEKTGITLLVCGKINDDSLFEDLSGYRIVTTGYIASDEAMSEVYSAADVFVAPSRAEAFSLVVAESMACGTPVIGSSAGGIPELVTSETGWIFDNGNELELVELIYNAKELFISKQLETMREKCRLQALKVDKKFFLEEYRNLYISLLSE